MKSFKEGLLKHENRKKTGERDNKYLMKCHRSLKVTQTFALFQFSNKMMYIQTKETGKQYNFSYLTLSFILQ